MDHVTCRLTAQNRDQLRNPTIGSRIGVTFFPCFVIRTTAGNATRLQAIAMLEQEVALTDLGFLEGVTLETRASEASEHCEGLGLRKNEI